MPAWPELHSTRFSLAFLTIVLISVPLVEGLYTSIGGKKERRDITCDMNHFEENWLNRLRGFVLK